MPARKPTRALTAGNASRLRRRPHSVAQKASLRAAGLTKAWKTFHRHSSLIPRIQYLHPRVRKVADIPRDEGEIVFQGRSREQPVDRG